MTTPSPAPAQTAQRQVSLPQMLAFIGPCVPFAALGLPLVAILPEYYGTQLQLGGIVGLIFFIVRCGDILIDPPLGHWMDRTRTKLGRFKLWMLLCLPVLFVSTGFIFLAEKGVGNIYLGLWLLVLYIGFSMAALSQSSWGSVLSTDYDERSRIFAFWQVGNILGIICAAVIPVAAQGMGYSYVDGVRAVGLFIMVALPITIGIAMLVVPEKVSNTNTHDLKLSHYFDMWKRKNVRCILWADLFMGLAPGIMGALLFYFFEQVKGLTRMEASIAMLLYFVAGIVGAPIWVMVSKKFNKHVTLIWSSVLFAVLYAAMAFAPEGNFIGCAILTFLNGIPYAASLLLTRALMADIGDEVMAESGHDHKGTLMAILSATTKVGYALSALTITILEVLGLNVKVPSATPADALMWVQIFFVGLPVLFLLLGAVVMKDYDLTPEKHRAIMDGLRAKDIV
ncbi:MULTISPECIES: MFS transporter [Asticcacaulis]|uniref:MFS transporter n=1 Tax=Asticcacaulis TaxID=76890 RepID=UPI001FD94B9E|nr:MULTISPECIES: MFS transporter [Asticcacaulis]MBP2158283.1 Na+/melibiose symporter-like transporter [Asticcacaulis solisilvae]MDR6799328.1 Na+/melibiose symporter-like transporter [Asticcacaulis sp. BE141]